MQKTNYKIVTIVGARPQFVKAAIVSKALKESEFEQNISEVLIHTGQHYDKNLSDIFFKELGLKTPDFTLNVGSGKPADQIGSILSKLEPIIEDIKPDAVLLYGDTNSTLAGCLVANHHNIPVIHVEAGERIYRRLNVPEERNRVAIDHLSNLCMVSTKKAEPSVAPC